MSLSMGQTHTRLPPAGGTGACAPRPPTASNSAINAIGRTLFIFSPLLKSSFLAIEQLRFPEVLPESLCPPEVRLGFYKETRGKCCPCIQKARARAPCDHPETLPRSVLNSPYRLDGDKFRPE